MATRRTTFNKRERERSKQAKAAAKRARRQDKTTDDDDDLDVTESASSGGESTEVLLKQIETLHEDYDAGRISFEDFDEQKSELVDKLAICLSE